MKRDEFFTNPNYIPPKDVNNKVYKLYRFIRNTKRLGEYSEIASLCEYSLASNGTSPLVKFRTDSLPDTDDVLNLFKLVGKTVEYANSIRLPIYLTILNSYILIYL